LLTDEAALSSPHRDVTWLRVCSIVSHSLPVLHETVNIPLVR